MGANLQGKNKPDEKKKAKKIVTPKVKAEHHYFKGHQCNLARHKQTRYDIEDNRNNLWKFILYFTSVRSNDFRARYMFRSYAALSAEQHRQYTFFPYSTHPFSRLRLAVEMITIVNLLVTSMMVSYYFITQGINKTLELVINIGEGIYLINIISNFFTGYIVGSSSRQVVLEIKKIAWRYTRTWLIVDLMFCSGLAMKHYKKKTIHVDLIATTLKSLSMPTLFSYTENVLEKMGASETAKTANNIILVIVNCFIWNMYLQFATEYYIEDTPFPTNPRNCSWLTVTGMWNASSSERIIYAFNRAVIMLEQKSHINLLEQSGCFEKFFIVAWRIGKILVIHCGLKYMILLFGLDSAKSRYFMMAQEVQLYMDQRRFPARIKKKVLKFYAVRFQSHFFGEQQMMDCVSGRLREDIIMHSSRQLVGEVGFLKQLPRSLLLQIGAKLKMVIFLAGDIIFKINTVGDCLYFIDKGTVAVYSESGQEICHLQDGDFFGEIALVIQPRFRTASTVAVTNCELFRLDRKDFESTIAIYPTVYEDIKKVAFQRLERTIVIDEHHKAELRTGNKQDEDQMP